MLAYFVIPLLAFAPGSVLLRLLSSRLRVKLSLLEKVALGGIFWNFILVSFGYIIGVFSNFARGFFAIFTVTSLLVLGLGGCYLLVKRKRSWTVLKIDSNRIIVLFSFLPLLLVISAVTFSHSVFVEYDAIFTYLPSAKSIVTTGGLQFNYYRQSDLMTADSPAMPLIYGWLIFLLGETLDFDVGIRVIPLVYVILMVLVIYLISKEIFKISNVAFVAPLTFLSMPVTLAITSGFSLYSDLPFTYLLSIGMLVLIKLHKMPSSRFWWSALGVTTCLMLLTKDISFLLLPSLLAIILFFMLRPNTMMIFALPFLFTGSYNILFIVDILSHSTELMSDFIIRQIPILVIIVLLSLLFKASMQLDGLSKRKIKCALFFSIPLIPLFLYIFRNLFLFGAITSHFAPFNENWRTALIIKTQALETTKSLPTNLSAFRWDILFSSMNLGAIYLVPSLAGLVATLYVDTRKKIDKASSTLLFFFLMLVCVWSWWFYCGYKGPEIRRLFYFSPFFAVFIAKGVQTVASRFDITKSILPRFVLFNSLSVAYLWVLKYNLGLLNIEQVRMLLVWSLDIAGLDTLIAFASFFMIAFCPIKLEYSFRRKLFATRLSRHIVSSISIVLMLFLSFVLSPMVSSSFCDIENNVRYVREGWENGLYDEISYIAQTLQDNFTIITCYALPVAYFTSHPVIEITSLDGIMNLLSISSPSTKEGINSLVEHSTRYLLLPSPGHSYYNYFENLERTFPLLDINEISKDPRIILLRESQRFRLFKISTTDEKEFRSITSIDNNTP